MGAQLKAETAAPRLLHLDGLRGLAVSLVIVHHFVVPLLGREPATTGAYIGAALALSHSGVDLFFVLSGYLIGGILLDHLHSPRLLPAFFLRRALRILPLAFLCIALILLAHAAGRYALSEKDAPWPVPVYLTLTTNLWMAHALDWGFRPLSHLWSIGIEEQFYLIAPLLLRLAASARAHWVLIAFVLLAPISRLLILAVHPTYYLTVGMLPFCRADSLGLGILAAWIMRHSSARDWWRAHRGVLLVVLGVAAAGCAFLTQRHLRDNYFALAAGGYTVLAVFYAAILLFLELHRDSAPARLLTFAPLRLIGRYAYFLYLFQGLVICLVVGLLAERQFILLAPTTWLQLGAGLVALVGLAAISWRYFESPLLALGRRIAYQPALSETSLGVGSAGPDARPVR